MRRQRFRKVGRKVGRVVKWAVARDLRIITGLFGMMASHIFLQTAGFVDTPRWVRSVLLLAAALSVVLLWRPSQTRPVGMAGWARAGGRLLAQMSLFMIVLLFVCLWADRAKFGSWLSFPHWSEALFDPYKGGSLLGTPVALVVLSLGFRADLTDKVWGRQLFASVVFAATFAALFSAGWCGLPGHGPYLGASLAYSYADVERIRGIAYLTTGVWLALAWVWRFRSARQKYHLLPLIGLSVWLIVRGLLAGYPMAVGKAFGASDCSFCIARTAVDLEHYARTTFVWATLAMAVFVALMIVHGVRATKSSSAPTPAGRTNMPLWPLVLLAMAPIFAPALPYPTGTAWREISGFLPLRRPSDTNPYNRPAIYVNVLTAEGELYLYEPDIFWSRRRRQVGPDERVQLEHGLTLLVDQRATLLDLEAAIAHSPDIQEVELAWLRTDLDQATLAQRRWPFVAPMSFALASRSIAIAVDLCTTATRELSTCAFFAPLGKPPDLTIGEWLDLSEQERVAGAAAEAAAELDAEPEIEVFVVRSRGASFAAPTTPWVEISRESVVRPWFDLEYQVGVPLGLLLACFWLMMSFGFELRKARRIWENTYLGAMAPLGPPCPHLAPMAESSSSTTPSGSAGSGGSAGSAECLLELEEQKERIWPWWTPACEAEIRYWNLAAPYRDQGKSVRVASPEVARRSLVVHLGHTLRKHTLQLLKWAMVVGVVGLVIASLFWDAELASTRFTISTIFAP